MSTLVNFTNKTDYHDKNYNIWKENPQLINISPFNKLYKRDPNNSKDMIMVWFLSEPDVDKNNFYRIPYHERLKMLKETFYEDFDVDDELIQECLAAYPLACLSPVERALKEEIDSMTDRAKVIRTTAYTLDKTVIGANGKPMIEKGTASQIDNLRKATPKLLEVYEKLMERFLEQQNALRVKGGRKLTEREKGNL